MEQISDRTDYALPAEFGIYTVAQVHRELADALDAHAQHAEDTFVVAAQQVDQIDAAALQLLCVLAAELGRRDLRLKLLEPSPVLERALRRFGAAHALGLPAIAHTD